MTMDNKDKLMNRIKKMVNSSGKFLSLFQNNKDHFDNRTQTFIQIGCEVTIERLIPIYNDISQRLSMPIEMKKEHSEMLL